MSEWLNQKEEKKEKNNVWGWILGTVEGSSIVTIGETTFKDEVEMRKQHMQIVNRIKKEQRIRLLGITFKTPFDEFLKDMTHVYLEEHSHPGIPPYDLTFNVEIKNVIISLRKVKELTVKDVANLTISSRSSVQKLIIDNILNLKVEAGVNQLTEINGSFPYEEMSLTECFHLQQIPEHQSSFNNLRLLNITMNTMQTLFIKQLTYLIYNRLMGRPANFNKELKIIEDGNSVEIIIDKELIRKEVVKYVKLVRKAKIAEKFNYFQRGSIRSVVNGENVRRELFKDQKNLVREFAEEP